MNKITPNLPESDYHAQTGADVPRLTYSIAAELIHRSPLHAHLIHPLLGGQSKEPSKTMDMGSALHSLILENGEGIEILDFDNFKTKAAQEAKVKIYAENKIPMLQKDYDEAIRITEAALPQFPDAFKDAHLAEHAVIWNAFNGIECQSRFDWVNPSSGLMLDLKTTTNAQPDAFQRKAEEMGYDIQAAFYSMAFSATWPDVEPKWIFLVVENKPPYAVSVLKPKPEFMRIGTSKATRAINKWKECLDSGKWPAYGYSELDPTGWAITKEEKYNE